MAAIANLVYVVSTAAFIALSFAIGFRLLRLSFRTGERPEMFLGFGFALSAGLAYGLLVLAIALTGTEAASPPDTALMATRAGKLAQATGVTCTLCFLVQVFRRHSRWGRALFAVMVATLWIGVAGEAATGQLASLEVGRPFWAVQFSVIGTYTIWGGIESLVYHRRMKRRLAIGLAEPMVVNRFWLWSMGSLCAALAIWVVNVPFALDPPPAPGTLGATLPFAATGLLGIGTVGCYWLTFFPPTWYRERVEAGAAGSVAAQ